MKKSVLALLTLLFAATVKANDAAFYMSGATLVPIKETDISISKEILTITVGKDDYATVDVYYEFYNPKRTKTITMAFEAMAPDYGNVNTDGIHPYIKDFTVEMNGRSLPFENALVESVYGKPTDFTPINLKEWSACDQDEEEAPCDGDVLFNDKENTYIRFSYCYFFNAEFKKGLNTVHHTYRYHMNENVYAHYVIDYWLTPAARWAGGKIGDFTLRLKSEKYEDICMVDSLFMGKPWDINSYQYFFYHENPYAVGGSEVEHFMLADLKPDKALEWHSTDFVPDRNITIYPADYVKQRFYWSNEGTVVVDDETGDECIYVAEDETRYFVEAQDYGWMDKSTSHLEERYAGNGEGCITPVSDEPVYVRMAPDVNAEVTQVIGVAEDIPDSFECQCYIVRTDNGYHRWFLTDVYGITGYVNGSQVKWEPYNIKTTAPPHDFYNYDDPTSVIVPEGVTYILESAFYNCADIKSVSIPGSVKHLGHSAFEGCSGLESVTLPDSISVIGPWTFRGCSSLTSVSLPACLTRIQAGVFEGCSSLTSITCNCSTPPDIWNTTFDSSLYHKVTLYVPKGSLNAYKKADIWKNFRNIAEK